jgi:hypothetical protein
VDEEVRDALRFRDAEKLQQLCRRAPVETIQDVLRTLEVEAERLSRCITLVSVVMPRCWCGAAGEPTCPEHASARETYDSAVSTWKNLGLFSRWLNGDAAAPKDLKKFAELWKNAGFPRVPKMRESLRWDGKISRFEAGCMFPECPVMADWAHWCRKHHGFKLPTPTKSNARERNSDLRSKG